MLGAALNKKLRFERLQGWFTLGLRKAEQSLKTGLFYYDKISTPCSACACASPAQPKNFYALEGTVQPSSARISAWVGRDVVAGLPDWTFLGPNLQNQDHFNHVWTKKNLFGPFELKVWTFFPRQIKLFHKIINIFCHQVHTVYTIDSRHYSSTI